jgi:hypothetical protein
MTQKPNLKYFLREKKKITTIVSYEDILKEVESLEEALPNPESNHDESFLDMDDYMASELDYQTNYIKKELERIADYYDIPKRKKRKNELIEDIVLFEKDPANIHKVYQRIKMWKYIEEIKKDKYLSQFLILD